MAVNRSDAKNPLVRHALVMHNTDNPDIGDFAFNILEKYDGDPVSTAVGEAHHIDNLHPKINKKKELRSLYK